MNKLKKIFDKIYSVPVLTGIIISQPIIDMATYFSKELLNITSAGIVFRTLILMYAIIYLLFSKKDRKKYLFLSYLFLLGIFFVINIILNYNVNYLFADFKNILKISYLPVLLLFLLKFINDNKIFVSTKVLNICTFIISFITLVAKFTNTQVCSYSNCLNGFIGWFYSANEIGVICLLLFGVTLYNCIKSEFSFWNVVNLVLILITSLSIGTKASYLGIITLTLFMFIIQFLRLCIYRNKENFKGTVMVLLIGVVLCVVTPSVPTCYNNYKLFRDYNIYCQIPIDATNFSNAEIIKKNFEKENSGNTPLTPDEKVEEILNGRDNAFAKKDSMLKKRSIAEKCFGLGYSKYSNINGETHKERIVERDYYDLIFEYGYIGIILILIPIITLLLYLAVKRIQKPSKIISRKNILIGAIILVLVGAHIAGHVLFSPAVTTYIAFILAILYSEEVIFTNENKK